jgi:hypothetical protein
VLKVQGNRLIVQLEEGVEGVCLVEATSDTTAAVPEGSLAERLAAAWKSGVKSAAASSSSEPYLEGQVRSFTIKAIDPATKTVELSPA